MPDPHWVNSSEMICQLSPADINSGSKTPITMTFRTFIGLPNLEMNSIHVFKEAVIMFEYFCASWTYKTAMFVFSTPFSVSLGVRHVLHIILMLSFIHCFFLLQLHLKVLLNLLKFFYSSTFFNTRVWASLGVDLDKTSGGYFLDNLCCK